MAIMAVHEDEVGFVNLTSCMEVIDEHLTIFCKKLLVNVSFFGSMDQNPFGGINAPAVMVFPSVNYHWWESKASSIDIG